MIDLIRFVNYDIHEIENTDINLMEHHIFLNTDLTDFVLLQNISVSIRDISVQFNISVFIEHNGSIRKSKD